MGLDYPSVRYVFHAGQSYSMEDYHQETGRLSSDGKKGSAIFVTSPDFVDKYMQKCSDVSARQQLTDWIFNSHDCRRERLTSTFDQRPTNCAEVDNERCDVCVSPLEYYRFHSVVFFQWLKKEVGCRKRYGSPRLMILTYSEYEGLDDFEAMLSLLHELSPQLAVGQ